MILSRYPCTTCNGTDQVHRLGVCLNCSTGTPTTPQRHARTKPAPQAAPTKHYRGGTRGNALSEMEQRVLDCLGRGIRQYEIATFLGISRSNVSNAATRLADKLCLASRADLVSFARRAALLQRVGQ